MNNKLLRHFLATLSYRASKVFHGAPHDYSTFSAGSGTRSALEILGHMGDVMTFTLRRLQGDESNLGDPAAPTSWEDEVSRFDGLLCETGAVLDAMPEARGDLAERLLQGPLSDVMCHVGQLSMLRRMAGAPIAGENFFDAEISVENLR